MGLINPPSSGQVWIGGVPVLDGHGPCRPGTLPPRHMGFVFQKSNLIPFLTAGENVQRRHGINDLSAAASRRRTMELLATSSVVDQARQLPAKCSREASSSGSPWLGAGQQPSIILADEPTAALDKFADVR